MPEGMPADPLPLIADVHNDSSIPVQVYKLKEILPLLIEQPSWGRELSNMGVRDDATWSVIP
jgi:hypothetical protein